MISALMDSMVDRFGMTYTVTRTRPWGTNAVAYYARSRFSWRAVGSRRVASFWPTARRIRRNNNQ